MSRFFDNPEYANVQWSPFNFPQNPAQGFNDPQISDNSLPINSECKSPTDYNRRRHIQDHWSPARDVIHFETTGVPPHSTLIHAASRPPSVPPNAWTNFHLPASNPSPEAVLHSQALQGMEAYSSHNQLPFYVPQNDYLSVPMSHQAPSPMLFNRRGCPASNPSQYGFAMNDPHCGIQYPPDRHSSPSSNFLGMQLQPCSPPAFNQKVTSGRSNSRARRSTTNSLHTPRRTSSLPVSPGSPINFPDVALVHNCQWVNPDGSICGAKITKKTISEHLIRHDIRKMTYNHPVACSWMGCRLKGQKGVMNRENIVRHIREVHLGYRRTL